MMSNSEIFRPPPPNPIVVVTGYGNNVGFSQVSHSEHKRRQAPPAPVISSGQDYVRNVLSEEEHRQRCEQFIRQCQEPSSKSDSDSSVSEPDVKRRRRRESSSSGSDSGSMSNINVEIDSLGHFSELEQFENTLTQQSKERRAFDEMQMDKYITFVADMQDNWHAEKRKLVDEKTFMAEEISKLKQLQKESEKKHAADLEELKTAHENAKKENEILKKRAAEFAALEGEMRRKLIDQEKIINSHKMEMRKKVLKIKTLEVEARDKDKEKAAALAGAKSRMTENEKLKAENRQLQDFHSNAAIYFTGQIAEFAQFLKTIPSDSRFWNYFSYPVEKGVATGKNPNREIGPLCPDKRSLPTRSGGSKDAGANGLLAEHKNVASSAKQAKRNVAPRNSSSRERRSPSTSNQGMLGDSKCGTQPGFLNQPLPKKDMWASPFQSNETFSPTTTAAGWCDVSMSVLR